MRKADILKLPSMPMAGPSYPAGPYRFVNREFLVITYETDPDLIRAGLPEPLKSFIDRGDRLFDRVMQFDKLERGIAVAPAVSTENGVADQLARLRAAYVRLSK